MEPDLPDLSPQPGLGESLPVLGVQLELREFTNDEHRTCSAIYKRRGVLELIKGSDDLDVKLVTNDPRVITLQKRMGKLAKRHRAMTDLMTDADDDFWGPDQDAELDKVTEQLAEVQDKLEVLLEPKKAELARRISGTSERADDILRAIEMAQLEMCHTLAKAQGYDTRPLETWEKQASPSDLANAETVVSVGNAPWLARMKQQSQRVSPT